LHPVSNTGMHTHNPFAGAPSTPDATDHRLTELEIKASFNEDLLEQLNEVVIRQQRQIDALARQLGDLRAQLPEAGSGAFPRAGDDLPPHY